jgi:YfiR/HmsC-like
MGVFFFGAMARGNDVPPDRQVLILTRALSYDDSIKGRAGEEITIAVLAKAGNTASETMSAVMLKAFRAIGGLKVQSLPLKITALIYTNPATLAAAVSIQKVDVLYVCAGLEADLPAIIDTTRKNKVVSIGSRRDHVERGLSIGVIPIDGKPTIMVNHPASKSEGSTFSSDLLRLAKVIK